MNKFLFCFCFAITFFSAKAQQYYVGVPVNITLHQISVFDNSCYSPGFSQLAGIFYFQGSGVTGLNAGLKVDSMTAPGSVLVSPFGIINPGDTIPIPPYNYAFYFSQSGGVWLDLIVYGVPQVPYEQYHCGWVNFLCTMPVCEWDCMMIFESVFLDSICSVSATDVNIEDIDKNNTVAIYPNPSSDGNFTLSFSSPEKTNYILEIQNTIGEIIYAKTLSPSPLGEGWGEVQIDLSNYGSGIYFLQLKNEKETATKKLIIQK